MKRVFFAAGALAAVVAAVGIVLVVSPSGEQRLEPAAAAPPTDASPTPVTADYEGFLYGRITTVDGETYEGRLRFGGSEEAFWGDYFNGTKDENPWADHVPLEQITERRPIEIFGIEIGGLERRIHLSRPFMARFGDIVRIEALDEDIRVTLKSGTVFDLDRFSADDLADGLRVWDSGRGVVDLDEWQIHTVEFLPAARPVSAPDRLHGTVLTSQGEFTGFIQWNREKGTGADELEGFTADGKLNLRFDTIRSIARNSSDSSRVTLGDGREIVLSDTREVGEGLLGIYVDDVRYGRVLVSWNAFEHVEFSRSGNGPGFDDFPPGRPLAGIVTTNSGRSLSGRLVYDLDESETTETLDAPIEGVDYTIPFGLVASIVPGGRVTLRSGEELQLERAGDLSAGIAGMLIIVDGAELTEYIGWSDVERVDFE